MNPGVANTLTSLTLGKDLERHVIIIIMYTVNRQQAFSARSPTPRHTPFHVHDPFILSHTATKHIHSFVRPTFHGNVRPREMFQLNKFQLKFSGAETKIPIFLHFADNKVVVTFIITRLENERTSGEHRRTNTCELLRFFVAFA